MPTNSERREVAAMLRELAAGYEMVSARSVIAACELPAPIDDVLTACGLGRAVYATEICVSLADLIEPKERMCHNVFEGKTASGLPIVGPFTCSECGEHTKTWVHIGFGDMAEDVPKFCPSCGAKVMQE